jgi:hypothetical protein
MVPGYMGMSWYSFITDSFRVPEEGFSKWLVDKCEEESCVVSGRDVSNPCAVLRRIKDNFCWKECCR